MIKLAATAVILGLVTVLILPFYKAKQQEKAYNRGKGSLEEIAGLAELKSDSDIIVEVLVTDKSKERDYKGLKAIITTLKVNHVIKGDKDIKEINILQLDWETIPKNGEKLLLFLTKGIDNPDCYIPIGAGQGIYKIVKSNSNDKMVIEPHSLVNNKILKDLSGDYEEVKKKLAE